MNWDIIEGSLILWRNVGVDEAKTCEWGLRHQLLIRICQAATFIYECTG